MRRFVAAVMAAGAIALGACEDDPGAGAGDYAYGSARDGCRQFASCGTCTPVEGCGWCFDSDGAGLCAASPDECATPVFSWTWNASGCRVPAGVGAAREADGGIGSAVGDDATPDAGADGGVRDEDAGPIDAGTPGDAAGPDGDG